MLSYGTSNSAASIEGSARLPSSVLSMNDRESRLSLVNDIRKIR